MQAATWLVWAAVCAGPVVDGNRLANLDDPSPYYPHTNFPKLVTPQWVGEDGVEAVVILAIDDMRDPAKYEAYLRPILQRLKEIDGRAPVSIMTCAVKPDDPQLQTWLQEGLSLEVHTFDHPCPLLQGGDFAQAKGTYDKCVDLMFSIPNNQPVAFRMPCCDSLNTVSPRFYAEIFNKTTPVGKFLQISSSVFQVFTPEDPEIPRELLFDADGKDRFLKYFPKGLKRGDQTHDRFVNYVENYPYPYIVNRSCWEFPCMTPSDWEANFLHQPNNPKTVEDMKAALDITVLKQGVLNLVFHPHGWIQAEQVNELIDHAVAEHGKKVKFLTFKEALERLNKNALEGQPIRRLDGTSSGVFMQDFNQDGYNDVLILGENRGVTRIWNQGTLRWTNYDGPVANRPREDRPTSARHLTSSAIIGRDQQRRVREWQWSSAKNSWEQLDLVSELFIRIDADKKSDDAARSNFVYTFLDDLERWSLVGIVQPRDGKQPYVLHSCDVDDFCRVDSWIPQGITLCDSSGNDSGVRFIDVDEDGYPDLIWSNAANYGVRLFDSRGTGWSIELLAGKRGDKPADEELPPIIRADGTDNGFFVRDRALHWMNEDTAHLPNLIVSWDFDKLLGDRLPAPKTPRAAIESMHVAPGHRVELMAHEPQVMDPVAIAWGADGKLWVAEMADYPLGLDGQGQPGGRIRYLADQDGDGRYENSTLFLDGVRFPNGVFPWKRGVLVSAAPDIFYAEDTDGDGKADRRDVLYTGFAEGNQQHRVNGFEWGLDGWLYLANGDSGGVVKSMRTGEAIEARGRDVRIHPESGRIETVAGQTQFGRHRDDWGHWFGCNNSNPMYQFLYEDRYLSRNPHFAAPSGRRDVPKVAGAAPVFPRSKTLTRFNDFHAANRFTSACSAMVYRDGLMVDGLGLRERAEATTDPASPSSSFHKPSTINPQPSLTFISEPVHNLVHREVARQEGVLTVSERLTEERASEFLASEDNWFRPTMVTTGPDGGVWVADMYRLVIEHPEWIPLEWQQKLNLRAGEDKGRLWRVLPHGVQPRIIPNLARLSTVDLVAALDSPNGWQRDTVQRLLIERNDPAATPLLRALLSHTSPVVRIQALASLATLNAASPNDIHAGLIDAHPGVRRFAVSLVERITGPAPQIQVALARLCEDPSDDVRLQLAFTLGQRLVDDSSAGENSYAKLLGRLALRDAAHPWIGPAIMTSLNESNLSAVVTAAVTATRDGHRAEEFLTTLIGQTVAWRDRAAQLALLDVVCPATGELADWQFRAIGEFTAALTRQKLTLPAWRESLESDQRPIADRLNAAHAQAVWVASDGKQPEPLRIAAIALFGGPASGSQRELPILDQLLQPRESPAIQQAAIVVCGRISDGTPLLLSAWSRLAPTQRTAAANVLLARKASREALLAAVESQAIVTSTIDAQSRQRLLDDSESSLAQRARQLFATSGKERERVVAEYLTATKLTGDLEHGGRIFRKACGNCHQLKGEGHAVGPDLAALTDKSPEALVKAIFDPNRAVESKFFNYVAVTTSGLIHQGLLAEESSGSLTLMAAEAKRQTILRADLDEFETANKSLMPEGFEKDLTLADTASLIAYIRSNVPLPQRKSFPGNEPKLVTAQADGTLLLRPADAAIFGATLVLEAKYGNLGYWSSADDHAVWTIQVPEPGTYTIKLEWACDPSTAGKRAILQIGDQTVFLTVAATGGWDDYQTQSIGELNLPAGELRVTARAHRRPLPALMDLKSIRLERRAEKP